MMDRRRFLVTVGASFFAAPALAFSEGEAESLVNKAVGEINAIIASGKSEQAMIRDFRGVFRKYADVQTIALSTLGPAGRSASSAQKRRYVDAFTTYFTTKYGRRFREFVGGQIEVKNARKVKSFYEVRSTARLKGSAPFQVNWLVSDRSGSPKFFNLIIEGVNTLTTERVEIGALLDKRGGDIDKLSSDLSRLG